MVYEPNQHDENVTPDNIVRSQFGTPKASGNGQGNHAGGHSEIPEPYRFDPTRPRQPRHSAESTQPVVSPDTGSQAAAPIPRQSTPNNTAAYWTYDNTEPQQRYSADTGPQAKRGSRAERRRAAEQTTGHDDTEHTNRSSDLDRIASFLRSTQQAAEEDDDTAHTSEVPQQQTAGQQATKERDDVEKTSELPTVTPPENSIATVDPTEGGSQDVLAAIRQIPGVNDAHMNEADNKLALDIADDADTESVHAQVLQVLDQQLGVQAQPATPQVSEYEPEPQTDHNVSLPPGSRVVLERIQVITSGFEATVEVGLTVNGSRAVGRATGPAVDWHILRGAADATVDAVGILLGKHARVVVEHASVEHAGSGRVAVVMVLLLTADGTEQLAGAAPVDGDRRQAVVHATLQALNRRLEAMLSG